MKALVWEPELASRAVIARALYLRGHEVAVHDDLTHALAAWRSARQPLVVAGWYEDGRTLELCEEIHHSPGGAEVVVLVAGPDIPENALASIIQCADDVVTPELSSLSIRIAIAERWVAGAEQRRAVQEQLAYQALHDPLTDLPNRVLFADRLSLGLRTASRQGHMLAALIIDLDRFKAVNDTYGHPAGDLVLQEAAGRLRAGVRASDTVARIGGDEFAAVLPGVGDVDSAVTAAKKIMDLLTGTYQLDGQIVHIGVSIGLSLFPAHGTTEDELLHQADAAMYAAKRRGGGLAFASGEPVNAPISPRTPIDRRAVTDLASAARDASRTQAEILRTIGQDLDYDGRRAQAIVAEGDGYRVREDGIELWFPLDELVRESTSRALRRQAH